jgi:hypothetical protein
MTNVRNVSLPEELCRAAELKFGQRFGCLDELIVSLLERLLCEDGSKMDAKELEVVEERLRGLGYV